MTDRHISPGDLVVIIRAHRCATDLIGKVFTVGGFSRNGSKCEECGEVFFEPSAYYASRAAVPLSWLKKIPPLNEPETVEQDEEATA